LPTLVMVAAALPTFHMLCAGIAIIVWLCGGLLAGRIDEPSVPLKQFAYPALYAAAILGPAYLAWIFFTKRLDSKEKTCWAVVVVTLNLIGMPIFYVFMAQRYLRNRPKPGPADIAPSCNACDALASAQKLPPCHEQE